MFDIDMSEACDPTHYLSSSLHLAALSSVRILLQLLLKVLLLQIYNGLKDELATALVVLCFLQHLKPRVSLTLCIKV